MNDVLAFLAGGGVVIAATLAAGWARGRARPRQPMCTCGHGYGTHDGGHGSCGDQVRRTTNTAHSWEPCPCRSYDGPDPLLLR